MSDDLAKVALFERLSPEARDKLGYYFQRRRFRRGEMLFDEGDKADAFYVVVSGQVQIIRGGTGEDSKIVAILNAGDFFGEMGLLEDQPRMGAAGMLTAGELLVMTKSDFEAMLETFPLVGMQIRTEIMRRHGQNIKRTMQEEE